jgi:AcrR family transcriptional regulator
VTTPRGNLGSGKGEGMYKPLGRDEWIGAARRILVDRGVDDITVNSLAKKLEITRGSFYHHFTSRDELLTSLAKDWEIRNQVEISQVRDRWAIEEPDLSEVVAVWINMDPSFPQFDIAVRMWARKDRKVDVLVKRVDDAWIKLLQDLFEIAGYGDIDSHVRARIAYYHQIGHYTVGVQEKWPDRVRLLPAIYTALTGMPPTPAFQKLLDRLIAKSP